MTLNLPFTVLTPTGDRFWCLKLLAKRLMAQTYPGPVEWVVVDDGVTNAAPRALAEIGDSTLANHGIVCYYVRRDPVPADSGAVSLGKNLKAALNIASSQWLTVFEDDDSYSPTHLDTLHARLQKADIVGTIFQKYYHLPTKSYRIYRNRGSALCSTAFRSDLLPIFKKAIKEGIKGKNKGYDARFWRMTRKDPFIQDNYEPATDTCIGMKSLPGRSGIGVGHKPRQYQPDPNFRVLKEWCGENAQDYIKMWERCFS